jgi:hypothetical protein
MTKKTEKECFDFRTIKSFEDACGHLGIDPLKLPDVSALSEEFSKPIIAYYKLIIIFKAINNGWEPDWSNSDQYKYFPWLSVLSSGFGFSRSRCVYGCTDAVVGSRLCTDTSEKSRYIANQFESEYKDFLLYSE